MLVTGCWSWGVMRLNQMGEIINSLCRSSVSAPLMLTDDGWGTLRGSDWREQVHQQVRTEFLCGDFVTLNCILLKSFLRNSGQHNAIYGEGEITYFKGNKASAFSTHVIGRQQLHQHLLSYRGLLCMQWCFALYSSNKYKAALSIYFVLEAQKPYIDIANGSETDISLYLISKGNAFTIYDHSKQQK